MYFHSVKVNLYSAALEFVFILPYFCAVFVYLEFPNGITFF